MTGITALDILKQAILLERRGKAFYQKVAEQAESPSVKEFFEMMAREEDHHIQVLSEQFSAYRRNGHFAPAAVSKDDTSEVASRVLSQELKEQIAAAGFEAAAVAAAMSMEERAIRLYSERSEQSDDPDEQALYRWLADWEGEHLHFLAAIDRDVTEAIWADSQFWPF